MEVRGTRHGVLVVEVAAHLEVAFVVIKGVVIEAHLARDDNCHLDIKGDTLRPGDPQTCHLT